MSKDAECACDRACAYIGYITGVVYARRVHEVCACVCACARIGLCVCVCV